MSCPAMLVMGIRFSIWNWWIGSTCMVLCAALLPPELSA
jgi:hypothetical protein